MAVGTKISTIWNDYIHLVICLCFIPNSEYLLMLAKHPAFLMAELRFFMQPIAIASGCREEGWVENRCYFWRGEMCEELLRCTRASTANPKQRAHLWVRDWRVPLVLCQRRGNTHLEKDKWVHATSFFSKFRVLEAFIMCQFPFLERIFHWFKCFQVLAISPLELLGRKWRLISQLKPGELCWFNLAA